MQTTLCFGKVKSKFTPNNHKNYLLSLNLSQALALNEMGISLSEQLIFLFFKENICCGDSCFQWVPTTYVLFKKKRKYHNFSNTSIETFLTRDLTDITSCLNVRDLSQCMRFPTIWYLRPAKPQISLRIRAVWSEPLLVARISYEC